MGNKEDFTVWYARQISNLIHETTQEEKEKTMKNNLSFIAIFAVVFSAFAMLFCGGTSIKDVSKIVHDLAEKKGTDEE